MTAARYREPIVTPTDVGTARQIWWGVISFGIVNVFATLALAYSNRTSIAEEFRADMLAASPHEALSQSTAQQLVSVALVVAAILGLGIAGVAFMIALQMRRGEKLDSNAADDDRRGAVLAIGSIILLHRKASNEFFLRLPRWI